MPTVEIKSVDDVSNIVALLPVSVQETIRGKPKLDATGKEIGYLLEVPTEHVAKVQEYANNSIILLTDSVAAYKVQAKVKIDESAEAFRLQFVTPGAAQAMVYTAKQNEAKQYQSDGTVGPFMSAEIGITAPTASALAELWLTMEAQWQTLAASVEAKRMNAKSAVTSANSKAVIDAILANLSWV